MKTKPIPIIVNGGLDTKTNPKLVKPGSALQIDNMYQQRPGEWRARNGMTTQAATQGTVTSAALAYPGPIGGVSALARGLNSAVIGSLPWASAVRFGQTAGGGGWQATTTNPFPNPSYAAAMIPLIPEPAQGAVDQYDGDVSFAAGFAAVAATGAVGTFLDTATGRRTLLNSWPKDSPPARCVSTPNFAAIVGVTGAGPYSFQILAQSASAGASYAPASLASVLPAATPWFDVIANPAGGDKVIIAYKATGAGVTMVVFDLSTGTITTGPTNFSTVDASMCLGFLNWSDTSTTKVALATAGATNGIAVTTVTVATLAASSFLTVSAGTTTNVRQVTGHYDAILGAVVLWELQSGTSRLYDSVRCSVNFGAAFTLAPTFALYSRTAKGADGKWYFVGAYDSPTQGSYALLTCDTFFGYSSSVFLYAAPMCIAMNGEGSGRRVAVSSVANLNASGSTFTCALPRKKKVTVSGVSASKGRVAELTTFTDVLANGSRARELGGVTYLPGGMIYGDDGLSCRAAVFPRIIEQASLTSNNFGGGSLTSGKTYGYRFVFTRQDTAGRVIRSGASVPATITLGVSDNTVVWTVPNPYLASWDFTTVINIEVYRVGPIESGAALYNLVRTVSFASQGGSDTVTFSDTVSDAAAALGEVAYWTGGIEEHVAPPSTSLLEVNGGRLWLVNAEDPTELWYSKESKAGTVPGFTPDFTVRIDGDGRGQITALGSMDGRLIVFKDGAIWVVSGQGPSDAAQGTFNPPQIVSRETGVPAGLARSVVAVPDGLMFQSARGIYLLDRGLGLTYLGAAVEAYTQAANVVDASTVRGTTQARFVMASGRCLVWDFQAKTWSTFVLPVGGSSITACVDTLGGWYYVTADGKLRLEVAGATGDDGAAIVPVMSLPHLNFAGLSGYQRLYSLDLLFDVVGNHTISVDAEYNYSGALTGTPKTKALTTATPTAQVQYLPPDGLAKSTAMRPVITVTGSPVSGTFRLTSVTAVVGIKSGTNIADSNRLT